MTSASARAAPELLGTMFMAAARASRRSLDGMSSKRCVLVYECTVHIMPRSMPKVSCSTFTMGAKPLVVHEALEMITCFAGS